MKALQIVFICLSIFCACSCNKKNTSFDDGDIQAKKELIKSIVEEYGLSANDVEFNEYFTQDVEELSMEVIEEKVRTILDEELPKARNRQKLIDWGTELIVVRGKELESKLANATSEKDSLLIMLEYPDLVTFHDSTDLRRVGIIK
jgi:hypothetical protein